jgi:hypothetical protein
MMNASIIEDVIGPSGMPQPQRSNVQPYADPKNPMYGMQMPQPLKHTQGYNHSAFASSNTISTFKDSSFDNVLSGAAQSSAVRGRVNSPHIYQYDSVPVEQQKKDYRELAGMSMKFMKETPSTQKMSMDPRQNLRDSISNLYRGAMMLKTHEYGQYSVYKCPVENLTGGDYKYIVAVVPNHQYVQLGGFHTLASLPWVSFQSRSTNNPAAEFGNNRPKALNYTVPQNVNNPLYDKIKLVLEEPNKFIYLADNSPVKIELLRSKEHPSAAPSATIMSALDAFRTIITFT